jgi:uncharacterized protein YjcR
MKGEKMSGKAWTAKDIRELAFQCYAAGVMLERIARAAGVSIWTVKYWRVRDDWVGRSKLVDEVCRARWKEKIEPWLETIERKTNGIPKATSNKRDEVQDDKDVETTNHNSNRRRRKHSVETGANTNAPNKPDGVLEKRKAAAKANEDEDERYDRPDGRSVEP